MTDIHFEERLDYEIPDLKSDFVNPTGQAITVQMDSSLEFLAIDFFGAENIQKDGNGNLTAKFHTEDVDWVISTFSGFGEKAEILSPKFIRDKMKNFLNQAIKRYET